MTPTVGVDNRHRMATATDSLSIKATNKLLPPTRSPEASPAHKEESLAYLRVHGNVEASSNKLRTTIVGCRFMVDLSYIDGTIICLPYLFRRVTLKSCMHGNEALYNTLIDKRSKFISLIGRSHEHCLILREPTA